MRVISGIAKGIPLQTIKESSTRPTIDRVKENLFNIIRDFVEDAEVADFFAGSGALCIEALSRGARKAHLVEQNAAARQCIEQNLARTALEERAIIYPMSMQQAVHQFVQAGISFDIIFLDPPHHHGLIEASLSHINNLHLLKNDGIIVAEHHTDEIFSHVQDGFEPVRRQSYGNTTITFFMKENA